MEFTDSPLYTAVPMPIAKINRVYGCVYFCAILGLMYYRIHYMPSEGYVPWMLLFCAELGLAFQWVLEMSFRWRPVDRFTYPERLSKRFGRELPPIDIFICTADPDKEPPLDVSNTVLSTLAFNYPIEKLTCYVSDDGGSPLTFYALLEASRFAKSWVPFCHKYSIQQRCPEAYFSECYDNESDSSFTTEWENVKKLYEEMKYCINTSVERGIAPEHKYKEDYGLKEWKPEMTSRDHPSIVQILLERVKDINFEGHDLPSLVYVSREKRPGHPHNFKAGALNVLIRVSALMSNAPFILTLDCDMYANNCDALREAMCFFMDSPTGHQFAYVQFPQRFHGITKNDLYAHWTNFHIRHKGMDGIEGSTYVGTGCVFRRDVLCGSERQHSSSNSIKELISSSILSMEKAAPSKRLDEAKELAKCGYEENTQWGKKVGMLYDCAVEDILTGLSIHCRGWKSAYCCPKRDAFVGSAPVNLNDTLIQNKRWATGLLEIFASKYCPVTYGIRHTKLAQNMCYSYYFLWAPSSLPLICYGLVPALCMVAGLSVFPQISEPWVLLFLFLPICAYGQNALEFIYVGGGSLKSWWNDQRMWMIKGGSSYLFALIQVVCKLLGISKVGFEVTSKVFDSESGKRYEAEIFELGVSSVLFIPFSIIALINLMALACRIVGVMREGYSAMADMFVQVVMSSFIVINSYPIYEGMLVRKDKGRMPTSITVFSTLTAVLACSTASALSQSSETSILKN
ncbi:cellulose synthase-like protein E6 isoform X1 [Cryptomeria japonica]|uniref:cellulose synthase-like protein E6 isoform X1 n=1 Tax=Cryptomeria japonica TaxID=3369 RepID=UPI0027DAABAD|nr:cellulose synthase-like protein E6 isoform X1 [Cryptomeria japonica]